MRHNLFDHVDIDLARTHTPRRGLRRREGGERRYERAIGEAGGIDIQLRYLRVIGNNGHIGFNEPSDEFSKVTHTVKLTSTTRYANSRLFDSIDEVPTEARTMGIGTIMRAPQDPARRQRRGQGPHRQGGDRGPGHPEGSRVHPAVPPRRDGDRGPAGRRPAA